MSLLIAVLFVLLPLNIAAQVFECPGSPPRYTNNPDHPDCVEVKLPSASIVTAPASPSGAETLTRPESDRPIMPADSRLPVSGMQTEVCKLYLEWIGLHQRLDDPYYHLTTPDEFRREATLSHIFAGVNPPNC